MTLSLTAGETWPKKFALIPIAIVDIHDDKKAKLWYLKKPIWNLCTRYFSFSLEKFAIYFS
jgi:hypothetical protein